MLDLDQAIVPRAKSDRYLAPGKCDHEYRLAGKTPVLGVAVPYAVGNVALTMLGPSVFAATSVG